MRQPSVSEELAQSLIKKHGSPLYVYKKSIIEARYRELADAIFYPDARVFYSCKANTNIEILRLLQSLGASVECVSPGEVERAFEADFPPERISYTCSNISKDELTWLIEKGVEVHLDSLNQVRWWGELKPNSDVSVRLNLGYGDGSHTYLITGGDDSKFGIYHGDIPQLHTISKEFGLRIVGILQHIGTHIEDSESLLRGMELVFEIARNFPDLQFIDFGGGFSIPYRPEEETINIKEIGARMSQRFEDFCAAYDRSLELRVEPGRYIVAESGALLVSVVDIKHTATNTFVGVDSGFNHLIRPALYGAYHHMFNLSNPEGVVQRVNVVGNICESADILAQQRELPETRLGDILLIADTGAYGYTMSSDYNLRPKPKEVVID